MSKLLETMRRASQAEGPRLGFGARQAPRRKSLVLLAELISADPGLAAQAVEQGIDGLLFSMMAPAEETDVIRRIAEVARELPWGVRLAAPAGEDLAPLREMGCDFVVVSASAAPVSILQEEKPGKVLEVDGSLPDSLLRAVDQMPVDAVILATGGQGRPTVADLMGCWRAASLVRKPLVVAAWSDLDPADISLLRETGAEGLVVSVGEERAATRLGAFRRAIEALPATRTRRHHLDATLPLAGMPSVQRPPEELE